MPVLADRQAPQKATTASFPQRSAHAGVLGAITACAMLVHGYHPYIVDASIYVAGIKKRLQPGLFLQGGAFVAAHERFSAFSFVMAELKRATHLPLDLLLLCTYVALLFGFLAVCFRLGRLLFKSNQAAWGATLLTAACLPIPVAATALLLIDPYLTARSFSSFLSSFAVLAYLEDRKWLTLIACAATLLFHPQMGVFLTAFLVVLALVSHRRWRWLVAACVGAFGACLAVYLGTRATPVTASYREAIQSRDFYFPTVWHWYEIVGVVAPLVLMGWAAKRSGLNTLVGRLALAALIAGATSCVCAFVLVHPSGPYFLARVQLLRMYHLIYAIGAVMLGGVLGKQASGRGRAAAWYGLLAMTAAGMFLMQRRVFATLPDVELPGVTSHNPWEQGFDWIRRNTPESALFAMDPALPNLSNEGEQGFRALTERSLLTDVKDEGVASLLPGLAPVWAANRDRQLLLDHHSDRQRVQQLSGSGVGWILLSPQATTAFPCPYRNAVMQVCRLTSSPQ